MKNKLLDKTALRFVLVGIINTLVGTSVMFLAYNLLHWGYWLSSAANYIVGSIVSYFLNKYYTFQCQERSWQVVVRFILNISVCYLIAYGIAKPLAFRCLSGFPVSIQENAALLVGMCLFIAVNYVGQRFFVFTKSKH